LSAVDIQPAFLAVAAGLVALALVLPLRAVWQGVDRQASAGTRRRAWLLTWAMVVGLPALSIGPYWLRGDPQALAPDRGELSEQYLQQGLPAPGVAAERLSNELERHLRQANGDPRAWILKARLAMQSDRHAEAAAAYAQALAGRSKAVNDAGVWVEYAEALGMSQGRTLLGEPQRLVHKALEIDGRHPRALDLAGSAAWEGGDYVGAVAHWQRLLAQLPSGSERHAELTQAIARAEQRARLALPPRR
jgi:cytochrome c-type biogenesis protein CcmH